MKHILLVLLFWASTAFADAPPIPRNPAVTQETLSTTICVRGYTGTVRPRLYVSRKIKRSLLTAAGLPLACAREFELDHRLSLNLGGAPLDRSNLQLQLWPEARVKDKLEVKLNHLVCAGVLPLAEAQACIWNDWRACAATVKGN